MPTCTKCNSEITFNRGPNGKWVPVDPDGTLHFLLCSSLQLEREGIHLNAADYIKARRREAARVADNILAVAGRPSAQEPEDEAVRQNIRKVACAVCAAKPGERCIRGNGRERNKYHAARRKAARMALLARALQPTGDAR